LPPSASHQSNVTVNIDGTSRTITRYYFCVGGSRYAYILGYKLDTSAEANEMKLSSTSAATWGRFGLLKDSLTGVGCPSPFAPGKPMTKDSVTELLGNNMRLSNLSICYVGGASCSTLSSDPSLTKLYTIDIRVAYGDDDVFQGGATGSRLTNATCDSKAVNSQYCFVTDLRTTARKGF